MSIISSKFKSVTASGEKMTANQKEDTFTGTIEAFVPIQNPDYPKMVGKIQIKVADESQLFEDVINFDDSTEETARKSLGYLQQHTKEAMIAAGVDADYNQEVTADWCESRINELVAKKAVVKFKQAMETGKNGKKSLKIHYLK